MEPSRENGPDMGNLKVSIHKVKESFFKIAPCTVLAFVKHDRNKVTEYFSGFGVSGEQNNTNVCVRSHC